MSRPAAPRRILDSHFHLFRRADVPQAGLLAAGALQRDFHWDDFEAAWDGLPVASALLVQVRPEADGLAEAEVIGSVARSVGRLAGMVAGNVVEDVGTRDELRALAALGHVRGIRRGTQFHPDPLYLGRPEVVTGFREVVELGLVPEVCVKHFQLDGVIALAEALGDTPLVVDHLGKPEMVLPIDGTWRERMARLAEHPGVVVKASVVVQQPDDPPLDRAAAGTVVREVIDIFGWDRVLFGSNWPVSTVLISYRDWVELLMDVLQGAGEDELDRFFYRNAARTWRLAEAAS